MEKEYAQALYEIVEGGKSPETAVRALSESLKASGRMNLLPHIKKAFLRIVEKEGRVHTITVSVAKESDSHGAESAARKALKELGVEGEEVVHRTDETLIGGWRAEGGSTLVDASYKTTLLNLFNRVTS